MYSDGLFAKIEAGIPDGVTEPRSTENERPVTATVCVSSNWMVPPEDAL
jgi:hypothetical protein